MNKLIRNLILTVLLITPWLNTAHAGFINPITEHISYQGQLQLGGEPFSGTMPMTFRLWNEASGGGQTGGDIVESVEVSDGLFQIELDFGNAFGAEAIWLEIEVDGQVLAPRQRIRAAPLALHALSAPTTSRWSVTGNGIHYSSGNVGIGTPAQEDARLSVNGRVFVGGRLWADINQEFASAVYGINRSLTGLPFGVTGVVDGTEGAAVLGLASATSGPTRAIAGRVFSADGHAAHFRGPEGSRNYFERRVGIGTEDPARDLHIAGDGELLLEGSAPIIRFFRPGVDASDDRNVMFVAANGTLVTRVAGTNRMAVTNAGNVGIGTVAPTHQLQLSIDSAFKPGTNTWTTSSDERLKTDIAPLEGALDKLLALRGVSFRWRDPAGQGGIHGRQMGLLAQDVEAVIPEWVGEDAAGYKTLNVGGFEGLVAEALRELSTRHDARIAELTNSFNARVAELEDQLERERLDTRIRLAALESLLGGGHKAQGTAGTGRAEPGSVGQSAACLGLTGSAGQ